MKKISILLLLLSQFLSAQFESNYSDGNNDIFQTFIIPFLLIFLVFSGIFYIVSTFEGKNKHEDYSTKEVNSDIWLVLVVITVIICGLIWLFYTSDINPYLMVIPVKLICAFIVSDYAKKKNRNPVLWWFLGFLEFHSALIVLALVKGLLTVKKSVTDADSIYNDKFSKLNQMLKDNLLNRVEFAKKKKELESEYRKSIYLLKQQNALQQNNDFLSKIENAYKEGLLTEEEYSSKISKSKKAEEKITKEKSVEISKEDEKEKLRRLHSDGVLTYDELKEKFSQIENYHKSEN